MCSPIPSRSATRGRCPPSCSRAIGSSPMPTARDRNTRPGCGGRAAPSATRTGLSLLERCVAGDASRVNAGQLSDARRRWRPLRRTHCGLSPCHSRHAALSCRGEPAWRAGRSETFRAAARNSTSCSNTSGFPAQAISYGWWAIWSIADRDRCRCCGACALWATQPCACSATTICICSPWH